MKYKTSMIIMFIAIFLFAVSATCAADANETTIATQEDNQMELTLTEDEIQTNENDNMLTQTVDAEILSSGEGSYSDLRNDIKSGNLTKSHYRYNAGDGGTIEINTPGVINGNGAVIDMAGSNFTPFFVTASGVTFKNLTIINANNEAGNGGAIFFDRTATQGAVTNCNFTNNRALRAGGAVYFVDTGDVTNCNFTNNTATGDGGAVHFYRTGTVSNCNFTNNKANGTTSLGGAILFGSDGTVTNCNFADNKATRDGGAVYFWNQGTVTNCNFTNNSAYRGGAVYFYRTGNVTNCNFTNNSAVNGGAVYFYLGTGNVTNCNFTGNTAEYGGAVYFNTNGEVTNCNFVNNTASEEGGAVYFKGGQGTVTNCNFVDNKATGDYSYGGAINMDSGTVTNCNFTGNTATGNGGAVYFNSNGEVTNCNFTKNSASSRGGAVCFKATGEVTNCNFTNNKATGTGNYCGGGAVYFNGKGDVTNCNFTNNSAVEGGAIYSKLWYTTADTCIFKRNSGDNVNTVIYPPTLNVNNFTTVYGSGDKLTFDLKTNSSIPVTNGNISISVYFKGNGEWVRNYTCLSGEGWIPDLLVGSYIAFFDTEYAKFQKINRTVTITMPNVRYSINVSSVTTNNKTVNITAKTDIPKDILWDGKLLFILPNGTQIEATYGDNGTWWAEHTFDAYGEYKVNATYVGLDNVTVNNATITVNKIKTELSGNAITTTYNINKDLIITLKDSNGNPVSGAKLIVDLNGAKTYTTDKNGQVKVSTKGLAPKAYTAKVTFNGNSIYDKSTKNVKVTVKKATPKITAKAKTFKTTTKTKKYAIVLKNNVNKPISKATVYLKVGGKTYKATTNSKGKATFKITNLNKKGTFKATVTYKGNKYYNKVSKKANIKVIVTFKTVSKGSKDKSTVREIQQALKDKGYYLSYKGHYLMVDGKFESCTERSVKEFQHDKGLKVTGKVDEKTAKKLGII